MFNAHRPRESFAGLKPVLSVFLVVLLFISVLTPALAEEAQTEEAVAIEAVEDANAASLTGADAAGEGEVDPALPAQAADETAETRAAESPAPSELAEASSEESSGGADMESGAENASVSQIDDAPESIPEEEIDTEPPVLKVLPAAVVLGKNVTPSTFVLHYEDAGTVTLRFEEKPDTASLGEKSVTIVAEDDSGNTTTVETTLYVCDHVIELELANKTYTGLRLREMVGTLHGYHPSIQQYTVKMEGATTFELKKGDKVLLVGIQVRDTTRPKVKAVDQVCYLGYPRSANDFVTEISDMQEVTVSFLTEPDWDQPGERELKIAVTDASYNRRIVKASAVFKQDDIPPVLTVSLSPYHYVGDAIAYKKGASAKDNLDPDCEITVDKSQVKYREVGTYPVTYTATDRDGNASSVTVEISFREPSITQEQLDELAESVLGEILKDDMSVAEQIKAVYNYCRGKIRYTGDSDKSDWMGEAYRGLTEFKGDCFTYYSASYLLLSKLDGVDILSVERLGGRTHHYWCLVNVGTGWYHYDTCPNHIYGTCFMRTSEQIQNGEGKAYWNFDKSLFPDVATKSFKMF